MLIETGKREKRMPAVSKQLGFSCPKCGLNYGSMIFLRRFSMIRSSHSHNSNRNKRVKSQRNQSAEGGLRLPKRCGPKPIENALLRRQLIELEEDFLGQLATTASYDIKNKIDLDPEKERQRLMNLIRGLAARIEARNKESEQAELKAAKWTVTQELDDMDPGMYRLIKRVQELYSPNIPIEEINDHFEWNEKNKTILKWNPIKQINEYRKRGDILRHFHPPVEFLNKVLLLYGDDKRLAKYFEGGKKTPPFLHASKVLDRYREPFCNNNWRYTWVELFWIAIYAKTEGMGKTLDMLGELDEKEGKLSRKHIKDIIKPVVRFWEEFFECIPYLLDCYARISSIIKNDHSMNIMYNEFSDDMDEREKRYMERINNKLIHGAMQQYYYHTSSTAYEDAFNSILNSNDKETIANRDRIKISHSNPSYKKDLEEYEKKLEEYNRGLSLIKPKGKPKQKTQCTINPWTDLPLKVIVDFLKEDKLFI